MKTPAEQPCNHDDQCDGGWACHQEVCRQVCDHHRDCAKTETCEPGVCMRVADYECEEDADCNQPSACQSVFGAECYAGRCHYSPDPEAEGLDCNDENPCTSDDACDADGTCRGEEIVCDTPPLDSCLDGDSVFRRYENPGACNPSSGSCQYDYDDIDCLDCRHQCLGLPSDTVTKLGAPDAQAIDQFGVSVALSGDYAIVGAWMEEGDGDDPVDRAGAAYVFKRTGENTWDTGTKLVAPDAQAVDLFGGSVALSGDYAIVGAGHKDGGDGDPMYDAGAAYVFRRTGENTWDAGTKLVAADAHADDLFGHSVGISGDYAIVGASGEGWEEGYPYLPIGAVYVFRRTGENTWDAGTKLRAPDAQSGDDFGVSVALSGDYAIVGASGEEGGDGDPLSDAGAAYVFRRTGEDTWDAGTKLFAPDAQAGDLFGVSVALSGDYAIAGARDEDGGDGDPITHAGGAYVFRRTGEDTWDAGTKLVAPDAQVADAFGVSVALSGDYAIVGAHFEDGDGNQNIFAGAAYVFGRVGDNSWDAGTKLVAPDTEAGDMFGFAVALSGDYAIVGAHFEDGGDGGPMPDAGAAYIYEY